MSRWGVVESESHAHEITESIIKSEHNLPTVAPQLNPFWNWGGGLCDICLLTLTPVIFRE
jgi:hypothetical protein